MGVRLLVRSSWSSDVSSEHAYEFDQPRIVIGRHRGSDVHIPHPAVSGHHATLRNEGARWVVVDEGSTNGTRVGGDRLPPKRPKPLKAGDVVDVGGFRLTLENKPVITATGVEETAALARRIVQEELLGGGGASPPRVRVLNGPAESQVVDVPEPPGRLVLGRGDDVDLVLADEDLSREHAELAADLRGVVLRDLESKNGTFVGDKTVREIRLKDGDEVRLGKTVLLFEDDAGKRLRAICDAPDAQVELPPEPEPTAENVEASDDGEGAGVAAPIAGTMPEAPMVTVPTKPRRAAFGADIFIYVLAGAVLALSIAGLVVLLRAG